MLSSEGTFETPLRGRFSLLPRAGLPVVVILLAAGWLTALFIPPWVSWHHEVPVFAAALLLTAVALSKARTSGIPGMLQMPAAVAVLGLLALLVVAQALVGAINFTGDAAVLILYLSLATACWWLGFGAMGLRSVQQWGAVLSPLAAAFAVAAVLSVFLALAQVFDLWRESSWIARTVDVRRPGANLGQPNHLGTLLILGMVSALYFFEQRKLSAATTALLFFLLAIGVAATESRTALLNFGVLCVWWVSMRHRFHWRLSGVAVACVAASMPALFWLWPKVMSVSQLFEPGATINTGDSLRLVVWAQLVDAVKLRPWFGWGLREVSQAHNAVVDAYAVSAPFTYAHNLVLDMALGMGVPLTVLVLGGGVLWLWRRVRAVRDMPTWYCVAMILPVAVHSMLEFPFAYAYFLAPVMFFAGCLDEATGGRVVMRVPVRWVAAVWLGLSVAAAWSVVEYVRAEEDFRIVRFEAMRLGHTPSDYRPPQLHLLTQLGALLEVGRMVPTPAMPPEKIDLVRKVALRFPWPVTQNRYALALALNGQPAEAERQLRVMRALHGERTFAEIKANWQTLAHKQYPQLSAIRWP